MKLVVKVCLSSVILDHRKLCLRDCLAAGMVLDYAGASEEASVAEHLVFKWNYEAVRDWPKMMKIATDWPDARFDLVHDTEVVDDAPAV